MATPPVFVINCEAAEARRERMTRLLRMLDLAPSFIAAVDGRTVTADHLKGFHWSSDWQLGAAETGCMLSHLRAWRSLSASSAEYGVVMEDDVHISRSFRDIIETLRPPHDELAVWRLEDGKMRMTAVRRPRAAFNGFYCYRILTKHQGTAAYMLNQNTARHLLREAEKMRLAIDNEMFDPLRRSMRGFAVFQIQPAPCVQENILRPGVGGPLGSQIRGSRVDDKMLGARRWRYGSLKAPFRPLYTLAYSLLLWPKGKFRLSSRHARDLLEDNGIEP